MEPQTVSKIILLSLASILTILVCASVERPLGSAHSRTCTKPPQRREWRTLAQHEQLAYLAAVICLANTPSRTERVGSIYDDFAFVHMQVGAHSESEFVVHEFVRLQRNVLGHLCWVEVVERMAVPCEPHVRLVGDDEGAMIGLTFTCSDVKDDTVGVGRDEVLFKFATAFVDAVADELPNVGHDDAGDFLWVKEEHWRPQDRE